MSRNQDDRQTLWKQTPTTIDLTPTAAPGERKALSEQKQIISAATLFASVKNSGVITIGSAGVGFPTSATVGTAGDMENRANIQLAPGGCASIWTDDPEKEFFDLAEFFAYCDFPLNQTQKLFLTVWANTRVKLVAV